MKKILLTLLILSFSFNFAFAQDIDDTTLNEEETLVDSEEPVSKNAYFDLELIRGTQNPLNREIPFTIRITPKLDSPKTQILWDIPIVFTLKTKHSEFVSLEQGKTYSYSATIKPQREGSYNIVVNVISWQHDTNKTNSVRDTLTLNRGLTVQPADPQYTLMVLLIIAGVLILSGISIFVLVKVVKKSITKLKKWLTPPF
ncbi:hypothetical protein A2400_00450 [candidate division WS6 bacterium RIFOXYB1_FULL_33_14]|uniref:CopC domain-containing protein n=1 Tax=candidate division WS6 bacterium RIFOXYB1_FULL_33_14 TaxID=1817896 RepID=A0A1F4UJD2_9BACT|nr:MAG: hypothetical protein A2400_00450 [candidate division WS6 bacterium RIFOXYB1_FULL_33_14]